MAHQKPEPPHPGQVNAYSQPSVPATGVMRSYLRSWDHFKLFTAGIASSVEEMLLPMQPGGSRLAGEIAEMQNRAGVAGLQWQLAMVVTMTETYLRDVLLMRARRNPAVVLDTAQNETAQKLVERIAKAPSLDALREPLFARWADGFVNAGPVAWIGRFSKWGVEYEPTLEAQLSTLWQKRNVVVHYFGVVSDEFADLRSQDRYGPGDSLRCTPEDVAAALESTYTFVATTDAFVVRAWLDEQP